MKAEEKAGILCSEEKGWRRHGAKTFITLQPGVSNAPERRFKEVFLLLFLREKRRAARAASLSQFN
jgi:hypothetical protein